MEIQLRDYQNELIHKIRQAYKNGFRAPLCVSPTGSGKTIIYTAICKSAFAKGKKILILEHRRELIKQTARKLKQLDVPYGIIAPWATWIRSEIQVASVDTVVNRLDRMEPPDMIIIDEAHHTKAGKWLKVINAFPRALLLGVTATPIRMDGKGLGDIYDTLIIGKSVKWLIDEKYLSPFVIYRPPTKFTTDGLHTMMGDYNKHEVEERIDKPVITGSAVKYYQKLCPNEPALVFCASLKHANHVLEQAIQAGITADVIDGKQDSHVREQKIANLSNGKTKWLISVDVVSEGTDIPVAGCAILLRPTKSLGLYLQQVGRVLRVYEGKTHATILDHVGNCFSLGLPDDEREWELTTGIVRKKKKKKEDENKVKQCPECYAIYPAHHSVCPLCGCVPKTNGRIPKQVDGELVKITSSNKLDKPEKSSKKQIDNKRLRKCFAVANSLGFGREMAFRVYYSQARKQG